MKSGGKLLNFIKDILQLSILDYAAADRQDVKHFHQLGGNLSSF